MEPILITIEIPPYRIFELKHPKKKPRGSIRRKRTNRYLYYWRDNNEKV